MRDVDATARNAAAFWVVTEKYSFLLIISRAFIFESMIPFRMGQREKQAIVLGLKPCLR